jgi:hypothetical protein
MTNIDITFNRAFRVWWSYAWRALVLSPLVIVPVQICVFMWVVPHARAAGLGLGLGHITGRAPLRELLGIVWVVCPIAIVGAIVLHTTAMRWMLRRARWAEFRLTPSPPG